VRQNGGVLQVLRGKLLIASPELLDPNFFRTVVLLLEHGDDGAFGLVLNRAAGPPVAVVLDAWSELVGEPSVLFSGGPVSPQAAIALAKPAGRGHPAREAPDEGFAPLPGLSSRLGAIGTVDLDRDPALVQPSLERTRIFLGYSGWGAGQLEGELREGAWFVVEARSEDVWTVDPDGLWRTVLARQALPLRLVANFPVDPTTN
jgi:putative transcriptional regulator